MGVFLGASNLASGGGQVNQYDSFVVSPIGSMITATYGDGTTDFFQLKGLVQPEFESQTYSYFTLAGVFQGTFSLDTFDNTSNGNTYPNQQWQPVSIKGVALVSGASYLISHSDNTNYAATTAGFNVVTGIYTPPGSGSTYIRTGNLLDRSGEYPEATTTGSRYNPIVKLEVPLPFNDNTDSDDKVRYNKNLNNAYKVTSDSTGSIAQRVSFLSKKDSSSILLHYSLLEYKNSPSVGSSDTTKPLFSVTPYSGITGSTAASPPTIDSANEVTYYAPEAVTVGGSTNNRWHMLDWGFVADRLVALLIADDGATSFPITLHNTKTVIASWPLTGGVGRVDKSINTSDDDQQYALNTVGLQYFTLLINQTTRVVNATYKTVSSIAQYGAGTLQYSADGNSVTDIQSFSGTIAGMPQSRANVYKGLTEFEGQWLKMNVVSTDNDLDNLRAVKFGDSTTLPTNFADWRNVWGDQNNSAVSSVSDITNITNFDSALTRGSSLRLFGVTQGTIGLLNSGALDISTMYAGNNSAYVFGSQGGFEWPLTAIQTIGDPNAQTLASSNMSSSNDANGNQIPSLVQTVFVKIK